MLTTLKGGFHRSLNRPPQESGILVGNRGEQMFLKKIGGVRAVTLADGTVMTRADLPPADTRRWVASRKAAVVRAVDGGLISQREALEKWGLSREELAEWKRALDRHGVAALRVTKVQQYRQP